MAESDEASDVLAGKRVLIVEDDFLISLLVEEALTDEHCVVVGPAYSVAEAMDIVHGESFDAAVMDVNLGGETTFAVARELEARGIPFLFVSGYGPSAVPPTHPHWPVCAKPFRNEELTRRLATQMRKM